MLHGQDLDEALKNLQGRESGVQAEAELLLNEIQSLKNDDLEPLQRRLAVQVERRNRLNSLHNLVGFKLQSLQQQQQTRRMTSSSNHRAGIEETRLHIVKASQQFDRAVSDLRTAMEELLNLYKLEFQSCFPSAATTSVVVVGGSDSNSTLLRSNSAAARSGLSPCFASLIDIEARYGAEDDSVIRELNTFLQRVVSSHSKSEEDDRQNESVLNEVYSQSERELTRLQQAFETSEMRKVLAEIELDVVNAELETLANWLSNHGPECVAPPDAVVSHLDTALSIENARSLLERHQSTTIPSLLHEVSSLQISQVLHSDYNAKLVRQEAQLSKMDQMLQHLVAQTSRHEFLLTMLQAELEQHQYTRSLLDAARNELERFFYEYEERNIAYSNAMEEIDSEMKRAAVRADDTLPLHLFRILSTSNANEDVITEGVISRKVQKLAKEISDAQTELTTTHQTDQAELASLKSIDDNLRQALFGSLTSPTPQLLPPATHLALRQLEEQTNTFAVSLEKILREREENLKIIQRNQGAMQLERSMFIKYLSNENELEAIREHLAGRIEAQRIHAT